MVGRSCREILRSVLFWSLLSLACWRKPEGFCGFMCPPTSLSFQQTIDQNLRFSIYAWRWVRPLKLSPLKRQMIPMHASTRSQLSDLLCNATFGRWPQSMENVGGWGGGGQRPWPVNPPPFWNRCGTDMSSMYQTAPVEILERYQNDTEPYPKRYRNDTETMLGGLGGANQNDTETIPK